jgi:hypothetical protein
MSFHPAPHNELSTQIDDPQDFLDDIYQRLLEVRPYFPGDTNCTGHCIDSLLERLEMQGAKRSFDSD